MFKYLSLSSMLKELVEKKTQLKNVVYKQKQIQHNVAYSNLSLILNNFNKFQQMYFNLRKKGQIIHNKYLLFVLVAEKINVGTIKGGGKVKTLVQNNIALIPNISKETKINKEWIHIRLRTIHKDEEQYEQWKVSLQNFRKNQIIPGMFDLKYNEYSDLVKKNSNIFTTHYCVIQSFSSALPPFLLFQGLLNHNNKNKAYDIIDACSAPGNKTLQLSEILGDQGTVFAFQKNEKRYNTLLKNMQRFKARNVRALQNDFLTLDPKQESFKNVKLILLDPSCSGSGMLTNFSRDYQIEKQQENETFREFCKRKYRQLSEQQKQRVQSLHEFQLSLLCHAAKFKPQRISFSTCSIYIRENEDTVKEFLEKNPEYQIKNAKSNLNSELLLDGFGKSYRKCVRVDPRKKYSDGFFVCIFYRKTEN